MSSNEALGIEGLYEDRARPLVEANIRMLTDFTSHFMPAESEESILPQTALILAEEIDDGLERVKLKERDPLVARSVADSVLFLLRKELGGAKDERLLMERTAKSTEENKEIKASVWVARLPGGAAVKITEIHSNVYNYPLDMGIRAYAQTIRPYQFGRQQSAETAQEKTGRLKRIVKAAKKVVGFLSFS